MIRKALCISIGVVLAFAWVVFAPAARASEWDQATQLTFNQSVEVPGNVVLPAGTYWFVLTDNAVTVPDIVQIFNVDRTQVLATIKTIPTLRPEATDHSELTFAEQLQKQPIALINWFYPGRVTGHVFIYASHEEARLSESEQITVMAKTVPLVEIS
jgi:hypothetical protein